MAGEGWRIFRAMRNLCITLLLALVVSNAMMGLHVATHVSAEPSECQLCTVYGDSATAMPTAGLSLPINIPAVEAIRFSSAPETSRSILSVRQRGPPLLD